MGSYYSAIFYSLLLSRLVILCSFLLSIQSDYQCRRNPIYYQMSSRLQELSKRLPGNDNRVSLWRSKYPLSRTHFRNVLYGEKYAKVSDSTFDVIIKNPHIFKHSNIEEFNRQQERLSGARMVLTMHKSKPVPQSVYDTDLHALSIIAHTTYHFDPGFCVKCDITFFLYAKTIYFYASQNPVQQKFVREAMTVQHIGCFGLTQLGHGSNVKGIQTQAIYDKSKKEFIINSPTQQSMKFWIGASAELATMSVIWAQLIVDGVTYGPQPFIVPIRDPKSHTVYPGVTIGDCGNKNGLNLIDNGYLLFKNYRIPKDYSLDRISGVDQNGKYFNKAQNPDRLFGLYMGPLSSGRAFVACNSMGVANSSLAIAIRFSSTRRQFSIENDKPEQLLIDYSSMRSRIMPNLAQCFVYIFGGVNLLKMYDLNAKQLMQPKNKLIQQLHAITGPCKAKSSWFASKVITQCRQICGGHGYSAYSGLNRIYHGQDINTSWEGDNNMLLQQTTKYILKIYDKLNRGKTFENNVLGFLTQNIEIQQKPSKLLLYNLDYLEKIIKIRVRDLTQQCVSSMIEQKSQGFKSMDIWNNAQPFYGNSISLTFGDLYYLQFIKKIIPLFNPDWKQIAENCTRLWVFNLLLQWKWGSKQTRKLVQESFLEIVQWLAPRSVSIIDAMAAPSEVIGSVFADENGQWLKHYITRLFSGKKVFEKVQWSNKIVNFKQNA